jgi:surface protein
LSEGCKQIPNNNEEFRIIIKNWIDTDTRKFVQAEYGNISDWDTSQVTNMNFAFDGQREFNENIGCWDTSNVMDMGYMFYQATAFDQDLSKWNTSKVTSMEKMFCEASSFNQPLSNWKTPKVTNMDYMFENATAFNQDLSGWCVPSLRRGPYGMFSKATNMTQEYKFEWNNMSTCMIE